MQRIHWIPLALIVTLASGIARCEEPKNASPNLTKPARELVDLENEGFKAIVKNDAEAIGRSMADDWCIIHVNGSIMSRAIFLNGVKTGQITHHLMNGTNWRVKIYGATAVVTYEARSAGKLKGKAFSTHERATSVYANIDGHWTCVLTQLTSLKKK